MSAMKRCSRCRKNKSTDDYGYKKNNTEYKTCLTCRDKSSSSSSSFLDVSSLYGNCLGGCVNPSAGLHHFRCPNYVAPPPNFDNVRRANEEVAKKEFSRNVMKNGASSSEDSHRISTIIYLITFPEIVRTFEGYGYKVYTMEDINPFYWDRRDFKNIAIKIANTKSVFLMYLSDPLTLEM
jgi:hypothetical protein